MRIVDVQFHLFPVPAAVPAFRWRAGLPGSEPASVGGVLRILTDDGHEGLAPTHRGVIVADLVERRIRAELLGQDPLQREWLWRRLWELDPLGISFFSLMFWIFRNKEGEGWMGA